MLCSSSSARRTRRIEDAAGRRRDVLRYRTAVGCRGPPPSSCGIAVAVVAQERALSPRRSERYERTVSGWERTMRRAYIQGSMWMRSAWRTAQEVSSRGHNGERTSRRGEKYAPWRRSCPPTSHLLARLPPIRHDAVPYCRPSPTAITIQRPASRLVPPRHRESLAS